MKTYLQLTPETTHVAERLGIPAPNGVVSTTGRTTIDVSRHTKDDNGWFCQ